MNSVKQSWNEYFNAVYPNGAAPTQHDQVRQGFYAGYMQCLADCYKLGDESVSESIAVNFLQDRKTEIQKETNSWLQEFKERYGEGAFKTDKYTPNSGLSGDEGPAKEKSRT